MITDEGKLVLLDFQDAALENCIWGLGTNDLTVTASTILADITPAGWTGYFGQGMGVMNAATLVAGRAQKVPVANPTFSNTSGGDVTFYVVYLTDPVTGKLIDARNIGATTIPDGQTYVILPAVTDTQE